MRSKDKHGAGSDVMSSRALMSKRYETHGFFGKYRTLFGDPAIGFAALFHGRPGHGKSSLAIQFSRYLAEHHGEVLYVSSEQYDSASLQDNLRRAGGAVDGLDFAKRLPTSFAGYAFLVIDSVANLRITAKDVQHIRERNPRLGVILIQQVTKTGTYRGTTEIAHDVDIQVEVVEGRAATSKNRFAPLSAIEVFRWTGENLSEPTKRSRK